MVVQQAVASSVEAVANKRTLLHVFILLLPSIASCAGSLWKAMVRPALLRLLQQMLSLCCKERNKARATEINHKSHFLMGSMATRAWQTEWGSMCSFIGAVMLWLSSLPFHDSWGSHTIFRSQRTRNLLLLCNWSAGDLELMGEVHWAPHHPEYFLLKSNDELLHLWSPRWLFLASSV